MALVGVGGIGLIKVCKHCGCVLNNENAAKKNAKYWRNECKLCRSAMVMQYQKDNAKKRREYVNAWARKTGRVKEYLCENCNNPCYKKYARAFCSSKCRFLSYVVINEVGCWLWIGAKERKGYGRLCFENKKNAVASRVSYEIFKGTIPEGKYVCHSCDNPSCVKPAHLWIGTAQENASDMISKGRSLKGEQHIKSKLSKECILKIRQLAAEGLSQIEISKIYNARPGHINNIIKRRAWKHI